MAVCFRFPILCILLVLLAAGGISAAQSAAPPPVDCSSLVLSMADCLSYVTAGGTAVKPEGDCCSGLKSVLKTDAQCLCETFRNSAQLGVTLNMTKALALPDACHVSAPSVGNCAVSTGIGAAPAQSPLAVSPSVIAGGPTAGIGATDGGAPALPPASGNSGSPSLIVSVEMLIYAALAAVFYGLF